MKYITKEVKIGAAAVIALCILIYGINYLKGIHLFKPTAFYYVRLANANGMTKSSPVIVDGFQVGLVRGVEFDYAHPGNIVAEIDVNPKLHLPKGTVAQVSNEVLGAVKMTLVLDKASYEYCQVGDTISGYLDKGMMGKVDKIMPRIESIIPRLDSILVGLNEVLKSNELKETLGQLHQTTINLNGITKAWNKMSNQDIPVIVGNLKGISSNLYTVSNELKEIPLKQQMMKVDSLLNHLNQTASQFGRTDNTVGLLLNDRTLYDNLNQTTIDAQSLLKDLKENPKRYVHFSIFGRKR